MPCISTESGKLTIEQEKQLIERLTTTATIRKNPSRSLNHESNRYNGRTRKGGNTAIIEVAGTKI